MKYDLNRFLEAQKYSYEDAKRELINGRKESHWMWYIFPQARGLGFSDMSYIYGIENYEEAREYYNHPILGKRLVELCDILLQLDENDPDKIFGVVDSMKLKSSMTLFYKAGCNEIFRDVLRKYFKGELDLKTIELLEVDKDDDFKN